MKWISVVATVATLLVTHLQALEPPLASSVSPSETGTETILVPITTYGLVGAYGSVWDTDLWVTNTTDAPIIYYFGVCQVSAGCDILNTFAPQETRIAFGFSPRGQWYHLPADGALQVQARFRDRTLSPYSAGVELPIVREKDFRSGPVQLVGVPADGRFRVTVRIYALVAGVIVRVEQLDANGLLLREDDLLVDPPSTAFESEIPAYAQLSIATTPTDSAPIRVRIQSLTANQPLWAFASVTNNESGQVTLITPWW